MGMQWRNACAASAATAPCDLKLQYIEPMGENCEITCSVYSVRFPPYSSKTLSVRASTELPDTQRGIPSEAASPHLVAFTIDSSLLFPNRVTNIPPWKLHIKGSVK